MNTGDSSTSATRASDASMARFMKSCRWAERRTRKLQSRNRTGAADLDIGKAVEDPLGAQVQPGGHVEKGVGGLLDQHMVGPGHDQKDILDAVLADLLDGAIENAGTVEIGLADPAASGRKIVSTICRPPPRKS